MSSSTTMDFLFSTMSSITMTMSLSDFKSAVLWALIVGVILAFLLGFGMGANDVSNAFGTSVGSGVLTLRNAYILACIFETLGALLVGYNVTDTMRKGVVDVDLYQNTPKQFMIGQVGILAGCSIWLMIATFAHLPVSTTHSVTGATVGFGLVTRGGAGIRWSKIINIVISWFLSPLLAGSLSLALFIAVDFAVLRRKNSFKCGLRSLPILYWCCIAFNIFVVTFEGSKLLHLQTVPLWASFTISFASATIIALIVHFFAVPRLKRWVEDQNLDGNAIPPKNTDGKEPPAFAVASNGELCEIVIYDKEPKIWPAQLGLPERKKQCEWPTSSSSSSSSSASTTSTPESNCLTPIKRFFKWFLPDRDRPQDAKSIKLFSSIQVLTACFAGFAHGANDVSNAIAPLVALLAVYMDMDVEQRGETPIYVLLYGVCAICIGLIALGHRVIRTVGTKMSEVNAASGFTIETGAAVTALLASKFGLPISTTHSLVGSVVIVGFVRTRKGIDWKLFRNIALSWVVTLPVSGILAAGVTYFLDFAV